MSKNLVEVSISAFESTALTSAEIPDGVTTIGGRVFSNRPLTSYYSGSGLVNVKTGASTTLSETSVNLMAGDTKSLSATVESKETRVSWSSDNTSVATVNNGNILAVGKGKAAIYAVITVDGPKYTASCDVEIVEPAASTLRIISASATDMGKDGVYVRVEADSNYKITVFGYSAPGFVSNSQPDVEKFVWERTLGPSNIGYYEPDESVEGRFKPKGATFTLYCADNVTLSDGTARYFFIDGDGRELWFTYTNVMTVKFNHSATGCAGLNVDDRVCPKQNVQGLQWRDAGI